MVSFPSCKINLGLHVIAKRADGYHEIDTCFYPVPLTDILEIIPSKTFSFTCTGLDLSGEVEENLCVKAYKLLKKDYPLGEVNIHLHKIIPSGAGLGGGSSNASSTLVLLNTIFQLGLSTEKLMKYATMLGSDCAFFLENKPMIGSGRGEVLEKIDLELKYKYVAIVKPPIHVSTTEAYAQVAPKQPFMSVRDILKKDISLWKHELKNDFEESVIANHPVIGEIKSKLYTLGADYASMSGSGSAVFGIFDKQVNLQDEFSGTTYWWGQLNS